MKNKTECAAETVFLVRALSVFQALNQERSCRYGSNAGYNAYLDKLY